MVKIKLNTAKLYQKIESAFQNTASDFAEMQKEQMLSVKWDWPRITVRQNGTIVYSPRDIIDTGKLFDSLELQNNQKLSYQYNWNTDYAAKVHNGEQGKPARPWVSEAVKENDLVLNFKNNLQKRL